VGRAGLAKGAFYHYWSSKDDLLREILASVLGAQCELAEQYAEADGSAVDRLGAFIVGLIELVVEYRDEVKIFHAQTDKLTEPAFDDIREMSARFHAGIRRMVDQGVAAGELHEVDAAELPGWIIAGTCGYAYRWWPLDSGGTASEVGFMIKNLLLDGLRARGASNGRSHG
jgi:AcrR family transcriptional regulator